MSDDWERLRKEQEARTGWASGGGWDLSEAEVKEVLRVSGIGADAAWQHQNPTAIVGPGMKSIIEKVDTWLDSDVAPDYQAQPLAQDWARAGKAAEEAGEVVKALIACTGQNPRKGFNGTRDEMLGEQADTLCAAAFGIQHFTKDIELTTAIIEAALIKALNRATGATKG
jgi:hypothetical protein